MDVAAAESNEFDDDLTPLTEIYKQVEKKLKTPQGKTGEYLRSGTVQAEELYICKRVQREIATRQLNSYGQYNRLYARHLIVAIRPGGTKINLDGQHTALLEMASRRADLSLAENLPCLYIDHPEDRTIKDCIRIESEVFFAYNSYRKDPSYVDKMKTGRNFDVPEALEYDNNLIDCGVYIEGYDFLGDTDGIPMAGEYQWRQAIKKYGAVITAKACKKLGELQQHPSWKTDKKGKPVTAIRADMVYMLACLYDFMKKAKSDGKMKLKYQSLENFINTKMVDKTRQFWYKGISGATTNIEGALRIIQEHNDTPGAVVIGQDLLNQYEMFL
tara:strand:+ start:239 stop:1228 length:990 start_codon:yes stop_codon:yes gene_type:complete